MVGSEIEEGSGIYYVGLFLFFTKGIELLLLKAKGFLNIFILL